MSFNDKMFIRFNGTGIGQIYPNESSFSQSVNIPFFFFLNVILNVPTKMSTV